MPAKLGPWGVIIGVIALILIVLSLLFFTQQVQDANVPTPTGPVPVVTAEMTSEPSDATDESDVDATEDATVEATADN